MAGDDLALNSRGQGVGIGSPALTRSGPREQEYPVPSLDGPVVPQQVVAPTVTAPSASGQQSLSQNVRSRGGTPAKPESGSDFDVETSNDRPANDDKDRTLPPLPTSTATQTTEYTYASVARKAASKSGVKEELTGGKRGPAEVEIPGPPNIRSFQEEEDAKV